MSYKQTAERFNIGKTSLKLEPEQTRNKAATKIDIKKYPDSYHYERVKRLGVGIPYCFLLYKQLS